MIQHPAPCFVIADGGHARFVYVGAAQALHTRSALDSSHAHDRSHDLGTDRPGRSFESGSVSRHAIEPRNDPHEMDKQRFARLVAHTVQEEAARESFSTWVLVAPAHTLAVIKAELDGPTAAKLVGTLAKDLTKVPDDSLYEHVKEWVRPPHRAA